MRKPLKCPGFRFKPTDDELVMYHLKNKLLGIKLDPEIIAEININDFSPWDLPDRSILSGDLEWYFFSSKSKKYLSGPRMNRATETGVWKGTGKDKEVKHKGRTVAIRKTLVFYVGHPGKRTITNWVMHEYQMKDEDLANQGVADQEAYVICRVFEKSGLGPKNGAQYGAPFEEKDWDNGDVDDETSTVTSSMMVSVLVNPNNASCSTSTEVMNITSTEPCQSTKTCDYIARSSGLSAITSRENEKLTDDVASLQNNNTKEVEDRKGKKVNESDATFEELEALANNDLDQEAYNMFFVDEYVDDDSLDAFLTDDDLQKLLKELGD